MSVERASPDHPSWAKHASHHIARYLFASEFVVGRRVLDAGCGSGYGAVLLREAGAASVVGVDIDPQAVRAAQENYGGSGIEFLTDDCQQLQQVSGPFDVICNFENIEHLPHPEQFLKAAGRVLAPEGVLLVSTPDRGNMPPYREGKPANPYHHQEWYYDDFAAFLSEHFASVEVRTQVEATAVTARKRAVKILRQALLWANPLTLLPWRWWSRDSASGQRSWRVLDDLATSGPADYPVVSRRVAPILGRSCWHLAVCQHPRTVR
jgi:2-polyprenyl-3-methyl-5-hydroxy-6-metoxy-1,4-benzoquinol methylase